MGHCGCDFILGVCGDMLCLVFNNRGTVPYGQTPQNQAHLSKAHYSRKAGFFI